MCPAPGFNNYYYLAKLLKSIPLPSTHSSPKSWLLLVWGVFVSALFFLKTVHHQKGMLCTWLGRLAYEKTSLWVIHCGSKSLTYMNPNVSTLGSFLQGHLVSSDNKHQDFCLGGWRLSTNVVCTRKGDDSSFNKLAVYTPVSQRLCTIPDATKP